MLRRIGRPAGEGDDLKRRWHVAFFVAENWRQLQAPKRNLEIVEQRLFAPGEWPANVTAAARRRLAELFDGAAVSETW